jgi:hypothetical protein
MRRLLAPFLALLLAPPQLSALATGAPLAIIQGTVSLAGRPLGGVSLAFVEVGSGTVHRVRSTANGAVSARVQPGAYVVTVDNGQGLVVGRGPRVLSLAAGEIASARVELVPISVALGQQPVAAPQEPEAPASGLVIDHEPVGCMVANQFPLIDAGVEPLTRVARVRVYFKSARSPIWYFVDTTFVEGRFLAKLPRPQVKSSPVTYYVQAFSTTLGNKQTPEHSAVVVPEGTDCAMGVKIAPFGQPGAVTVFSAATGAAVAPAGFAAGGLALTAGTIALVAGGAAAAGITAAIPVFNPQPVPSQTPTPVPPSPPPTPRPTPIPTAAPSLPPPPQATPKPISP